MNLVGCSVFACFPTLRLEGLLALLTSARNNIRNRVVGRGKLCDEHSWMVRGLGQRTVRPAPVSEIKDDLQEWHRKCQNIARACRKEPCRAPGRSRRIRGIARLVLCSRRAGYNIGQNILLDGGAFRRTIRLLGPTSCALVWSSITITAHHTTEDTRYD